MGAPLGEEVHGTREEGATGETMKWSRVGQKGRRRKGGGYMCVASCRVGKCRGKAERRGLGARSSVEGWGGRGQQAAAARRTAAAGSRLWLADGMAAVSGA